VRGSHAVWDNESGDVEIGLIKVIAPTVVRLSVTMEAWDSKHPGIKSKNVTFERLTEAERKRRVETI